MFGPPAGWRDKLDDADRALPELAGHVCRECKAEVYTCAAGGAGERHTHKCACGFAWQHQGDPDYCDRVDRLLALLFGPASGEPDRTTNPSGPFFHRAEGSK